MTNIDKNYKKEEKYEDLIPFPDIVEKLKYYKENGAKMDGSDMNLARLTADILANAKTHISTGREVLALS